MDTQATIQLLRERAVTAEERARFEAEVARQAHIRANDALLRLEAVSAELAALTRRYRLAEERVRELDDELNRTKQGADRTTYLKQRLQMAEGREKAAQYQIADLIVRAEAAERRAEAAERRAEAAERARGPA